MQVYADREVRERVARKFARLAARLRAADRHDGKLRAHEQRVAALILAGELVQGLADSAATLPRRGMALMLALARALAEDCASSWLHGWRCGPPVRARRLLSSAAHRPWPAWITVRSPEGYAHYALYPELYLEAALAARGTAEWRGVIGVRSIGTSLGAAVAAGLGVPLLDTVRPIGPPFERRIEQHLPHAPGTGAIAVVDEGPGLSGSSFHAVARWLFPGVQTSGALALFPGHGQGPGPRASAATHRFFAQTATHPPDPRGLRAPPTGRKGLDDWLRGLAGDDAAIDDLSGGRWRARRRARPLQAAALPGQERLKFLLRRPGGDWLAKFAGLGRTGERKLARQRLLAEAELGPAARGLVHGFLVMDWVEPSHDDAHEWVQPSGARRSELVAHLARYLAFRSARWPAPPGSGARLADLAAMARCNGASLGIDDRSWNAVARHAIRLEHAVRRVATDNRLHAWEWVSNGERLLKVGAVDHCESHDLVGCQDLAWDVAGAVVELALNTAELDELMAQLAAQGCPTDPALLRLCMPCYVAFQLGAFTMGLETSPADDQPAIERQCARLRQRLPGDVEALLALPASTAHGKQRVSA
jgi:hypothetical protein